MNFRLLNISLAICAVILVAANLFVRADARRAEVTIMMAHSVREAQPEENKVENEPEAKSAPAKESIRWAPLEAEEYSEYMANLRKFGFPDELIRQMIIAEVEALYEPRLAPLRIRRVPYDAKMSERNRTTTPEDFERMKAWQKMLIEKRERLESLLGGYVSREMIRTPISRNYEAGEYAVSLMPPEKREAVRVIFEDFTLEEESYTVFPNKLREAGFASEMESYAATHEKRDAALRKVLTEEELARIYLNIQPQGTELQRDIIGMEPTDQELTDIFKIADEYWYKTGGIYGRWRARPVPKDEIEQAGVEAERKVEELLGADRFVDYRMARTDSGRQLNNLAARYDVPRATIREAYLAQKQLDNLAKNPAPNAEQQSEQLRQKLQDTLGAAVFEAWENGKSQRYEIEP